MTLDSLKMAIMCSLSPLSPFMWFMWALPRHSLAFYFTRSVRSSCCFPYSVQVQRVWEQQSESDSSQFLFLARRPRAQSPSIWKQGICKGANRYIPVWIIEREDFSLVGYVKIHVWSKHTEYFSASFFVFVIWAGGQKPHLVSLTLIYLNVPHDPAHAGRAFRRGDCELISQPHFFLLDAFCLAPENGCPRGNLTFFFSGLGGWPCGWGVGLYSRGVAYIQCRKCLNKCCHT